MNFTIPGNVSAHTRILDTRRRKSTQSYTNVMRCNFFSMLFLSFVLVSLQTTFFSANVFSVLATSNYFFDFLFDFPIGIKSTIFCKNQTKITTNGNKCFFAMRTVLYINYAANWMKLSHRHTRLDPWEFCVLKTLNRLTVPNTHAQAHAHVHVHTTVLSCMYRSLVLS